MSYSLWTLTIAFALSRVLLGTFHESIDQHAFWFESYKDAAHIMVGFVLAKALPPTLDALQFRACFWLLVGTEVAVAVLQRI